MLRAALHITLTLRNTIPSPYLTGKQQKDELLTLPCYILTLSGKAAYKAMGSRLRCEQADAAATTDNTPLILLLN